MSQQVWCWGQDVEHADGNLLLRYGFNRHRDRTVGDRSTCYRLDNDRLHVALWGFGMFFGSRNLGGLYIARFSFYPKWAPIESLSLSIHWPDELPSFSRPRGTVQWGLARQLWKSALTWIAEYETWVRATMGIRYRQACVERWLHPIVRAEKLISAWRFLSQRRWEQGTDKSDLGFRRYILPSRCR